MKAAVPEIIEYSEPTEDICLSLICSSSGHILLVIGLAMLVAVAAFIHEYRLRLDARLRQLRLQMGAPNPANFNVLAAQTRLHFTSVDRGAPMPVSPMKMRQRKKVEDKKNKKNKKKDAKQKIIGFFKKASALKRPKEAKKAEKPEESKKK